MKITIIKKENLQPNLWNGGKTYQYYIHPENSSFATKEFDIRISVASIEKVPSIFTKFNGFKRYLVMLNSELFIYRNNNPEKYKSLEVFAFNSDDDIQSQSLGFDFNVMISEKITSELVLIGNQHIFDKPKVFVFAIEICKVLVGEQEYFLNAFDLLYIENDTQKLLPISTTKKVVFSAFDY
jgi:environmental stress-induced protein Ves